VAARIADFLMHDDFAERVLAWFEHHGRKDLPWQRPAEPYRVWVSEIMLQQTQVNTVIPYFDRFMARFPSVQALAEAPLDDVLHYWSGLGYYARARNLHAAARQVLDDHGGELPREIGKLQALPGIGRSTAGAVLSLAYGQRRVILDGNVKRVIARHRAVGGWPGHSAVSKTLWSIATELTPERRVAEYNQAMMDLGATLCTRRRPGCTVCPVQADCTARIEGHPQDYPGTKPRRRLPERSVQMLLLRRPDGGVLLERRPPAGVWGGLWCFPELAIDDDPGRWCQATVGVAARRGRAFAQRRHTFSHFHLDIAPVELWLEQAGNDRELGVLESTQRLWYNVASPQDIGLAAPIARLLEELADPETEGEDNGRDGQLRAPQA
jgi:A/G-specific adenine glycosylase